MKKLILTITFLVILSGCLLNPLLEKTSDLDKQHFKQTVTVDDHASNAFVIFSTVNGVQEKQGTHHVVLNDNFVRGFFNKRTRAKTYQIYNVVYYAGAGNNASRKHFAQANYRTPTGSSEITPTTILQENEDCSALNFYGQCLYNEHVAFQVDEGLLRTVATSEALRAPTDKVWQYALIPESGDSHKDKLLTAEVAGLLERMDQYISIMPTEYHDQAPLKSGITENPLLIPESSLKPRSAQDVLPMIKK